MNVKIISAALAAALAIAGATDATAQSNGRVEGAATLEDIPAVTPDVAAAVQTYQSSRSAVLDDWLADGSILMRTRFGATAQLHRVARPMGDRSQLTFFGEPIGGAVRIPGGSEFFFSKDTGGDEWFQLFRMRAGGAPVQFTEPGTRNGMPVVTADGSRIYWARSTKGSAAYTVMTAEVANPASRREVYRSEGAVGVSDVSPDGRYLLLARALSNIETRVLLLEITTGQVLELAPGPATEFQGGAFVRGGAAVVAISDRDSDVRRVVEIDVASGRLRPISPASKWGVEGLEVSKDGKLLAYAVNEEGYSKVVVQDVASGRVLPAPKVPAGILTALKFSPDGRSLAMSISSPVSPSNVYVWRAADGAVTRWTESEIGPIDRATLVEPKLVRFNSFDGLSVPAFVYRPKTAPGARTPVLILIHGGPEAQERPGWSTTAQYYVSQLGATVIVPNVRGSDGYGRKYLDLDNGPKREDSVKDIGALLDWVGKQPDLDASRVAVSGGSYGGYMVLAAMTMFSDRLAGGNEAFGISDWTSFLQNTEAYRRDIRRAEYGDERTPEMKAVFARISPLANVAKIGKPMLVEQGVNDPRVPKSESDQVVAALRARKVPVGYLVFADEGHGWRKKPNADLALAVRTMFFRQIFAGGGRAAD